MNLDDLFALEAEPPRAIGHIPTWEFGDYDLALLPGGRVAFRLAPDAPLTALRVRELTQTGHPFVVGDAVQFARFILEVC